MPSESGIFSRVANKIRETRRFTTGFIAGQKEAKSLPNTPKLEILSDGTGEVGKYKRQTANFGEVHVKHLLPGQTILIFWENTPNQREIQFLSPLGSEWCYDQPYQRITTPQELTRLSHITSTDSEGKQHQKLKGPWVFEATTGLSFFGVNDHSELYFQSLMGDIFTPNPDDVLFNLDPHHDLENPTNRASDSVIGIGDFICAGTQPKLKTWDTYFQTTPIANHLSQVNEENHQITHITGRMGLNQLNSRLEAYQFTLDDLKTAFAQAIAKAKQKGGKVLLTIDFDTFGCVDPSVPFDIETAKSSLARVFALVSKYRNDIRAVNFAESEAFLAMGASQVEQLYSLISAGLTALETGQI